MKQQKGAMFGLDARLTLAIVAAISIVAGASMVQIVKDRRSDSLLFEQDKYSSAVDAYQEDMQTHILITLQDWSGANAHLALGDRSKLKPEYQNSWLGPYLREYNSNNHPEYGQRAIFIRTDTLSTPSAAERRNRQSFNYLRITEVPLTTIEEVNERLDGATEATPKDEGKVQWEGISNGKAILYMRLGVAAP